MLNSFCFLIKTRCEKSASTGLAPGTVDIDVNDKNTTTLHTSADVKSLTLFSQIQTRKKLRSPCLPQDQFHWSWVEVKSRPWRNYIVENIIMPLLGCHSSLRICADSIDIATLNSTYPKLCRSLGMTCWPYASKPKHGATPFSLKAPGGFPYHLWEKSKQSSSSNLWKMWVSSALWATQMTSALATNRENSLLSRLIKISYSATSYKHKNKQTKR